MNRLMKRTLSVTLVACLMLYHMIVAFASEPEKNLDRLEDRFGAPNAESPHAEGVDTERPDAEGPVSEGVESGEATLATPLDSEPLGQELPKLPPEEPSNTEAEAEMSESGALEIGEFTDLYIPPEERESPIGDETQESPAETEPEDIVYDESELAKWISQHKETGGRVHLGSSVTITEAMQIYSIYGEITIDTGTYSLVFDGATLPSEMILITGEGVDTPVLDVRHIDNGSFWSLSWNNDLMLLDVTATGRDGVGGTALRIQAEDAKAFNSTIVEAQGSIRSYGEGAVGLWLDVPMEAWCYNVEVAGENSIAVYAPQGADLYFCKLKAEGRNASAATGNNVLLDGCAASPEPADALIFHRFLLADSFDYLYFPIRQNQPPDIRAIYRYETLQLPLSGGDEYDPVYHSFIIQWDYDAYERIDISTLGKSIVSGSFFPAFQGLGLDESLLQITVEVRDPALPCIETITARNDASGKRIYLGFGNFYDPAEDNIVLWRSDDEGATWWDATWAEDILWDGYDLCFFYDSLEHPVWFVLELVGVGDSNTVALSEKNGRPVGGHGGDRTGTDRDGGSSENGGDSSGDGGDSSGDGGDSSGNSGGSSGNSGTPGNSSEPNGDTPEKTDEPDNSANLDGTLPDEGGNVAQSSDGKEGDGHTDESAYTDGGFDVDLMNGLLSDAYVTDIQAQNAPAWKPAIVADSGQSLPDSTSSQTPGLQSLSGEASRNGSTEDGKHSLAPETPFSFDPEQSVPEPEYSLEKAMVFFLGVAALSACALLVLRFSHGRPRRGK